ncbi:hypothetical protein D0865_10755 [Hortaea werneckii]|uniref:Ketoreductase (KR) domain-containing protein n=1 Tax=Hortaea werneckii TaxID=91943 RepID=A0A3M7BWJ6_HORWE|nr:hypothetical protein D0865_10755 [Hortaea werneckii]
MSRPGSSRIAATNLGGGGGFRVLEGKVAIVTGGSRGIGAATCENLASKGASLIINYTSDSSTEKAEKLAQQLQTTYGVKCLPVQADMGSENGPAHIVDRAVNNFSHPKSRKFQIDIVINNAGVASKMLLEDCTSEEFARLYNVNVRGPLLLMKAVQPHLPTDRSGRVVNVSSVSAALGFHEDAMYGGTKAALEAMTRTPGVDSKEFVDNASFAGGRPAYEDEVAGVIAMLCTPDSGWCTGSTICANGGFKFSN